MQATRTALVAYGSETGNAQDVADEIGILLRRIHFITRVAELNDVALKDLVNHDFVVICTSTTGQGELPSNAQKFWRALRSTRLRHGSLQRMNFTSFGLGDSSYPHYQHAHRKLHNRLVSLGATTTFPKGETDEQHPEGSESSFMIWSLALRQHLLQLFPLPRNVEPLPENDVLSPEWTLEALSKVRSDDLEAETMQLPDELRMQGTIEVELLQNKRLTPVSHWQDVRHLVLTTPDVLNYTHGDTLTIFPSNAADDVATLILVQAWEFIADTPLRLNPTEASSISLSPLRSFDMTKTTLTLRWLLTNVLDIMSIPRRSFLAKLARYCEAGTDDGLAQRERLQEFCNPEYTDEYFDYATRPRRSIVEVLQEFHAAKIPWQHVLDVFPMLRGRQFSIASGGLLKQFHTTDPDQEIGVRPHQEHDLPVTRFELIVAIVKYKTIIRRTRKGVCTRYIESLAESSTERPTTIHVRLNQGSLRIPTSNESTGHSSPVVMIAPGTGVAPCRSLIYERQPSLRALPYSCKDILIFGARNRSADYFFAEEWLHFHSTLVVFTAFSRDQKEKVYVQDVVRRECRMICDAILENKGYIVVCGSTGNMPKAVREALTDVFQAHAKTDRASAEKVLLELEKSGRYWQETW